MKFKKLAVASAIAVASVGASADTIFSSDFGSSFGAGNTTFTDVSHTWADVAAGLLSWELGVIGTGPISITKVTFNGVAATALPGFPKIFTGSGQLCRRRA